MYVLSFTFFVRGAVGGAPAHLVPQPPPPVPCAVRGCAFPQVIPVDDSANRFVTNMTLFLLLVAFKFSVSDGLPKIGYATLFDRYLIGCFLHLLIDPIVYAYFYVRYDGRLIQINLSKGDFEAADEADEILWTVNMFVPPVQCAPRVRCDPPHALTRAHL